MNRNAENYGVPFRVENTPRDEQALETQFSSQTLRIERELPYASNSPLQRLDLVLPEKTPSPAPILVFIHGGAWISDDKADYAWAGLTFASQGIAVALFNYQLSTTPGLHHPVHAQDLASLILYLSERGDHFGFDPRQIFISGHCAGAHMGAVLASSPPMLNALGVAKRFWPKGYIGLSGIYDIPQLSARYPRYRDWFLTKVFSADESKWLGASPSQFKYANKEPWLLIHSAADELVEPKQTEDFAVVLKKQGVPTRVLRLEGLSHEGTARSLFSSDTPGVSSILSFIRETELQQKLTN